MSELPEALWLNVSPSLQGFDRPLLRKLSQRIAIAQWQYCQTPDEARSLEIVLEMLDDYLQQFTSPLHLLGHGASGLLALLYACRHPEGVKSLTLLSVGAYPAVDWQFHYYAQLEQSFCCRAQALTQIAYQLFGYQSPAVTQNLIGMLEKDLLQSPSPHTLLRRVTLLPNVVPVPFLVCGSEDDLMINYQALQGWKPWMSQGDRLWQAPSGRYFFHYFHPQQVSEQILDFWRSLPSSSAERMDFETATLNL
jgi:pimeloyl-ACP methyl ester carboxylesterase